MSRAVGRLMLILGLVPGLAWAQLPTNVAKIGGSDPVTAICDDYAQVSSVAISVATSGDTELVALTGGQIIYICGFDFIANGTVNVRLIYGTGASCATGQTGITGAYPLVAQTGIVRPNTGFIQAKTPVSNALCIELSGNVQTSGLLTYVKR